MAASLADLRQEMAKERLDAYVVLSTDAHSSEYPSSRFMRLSALGNFGGSAGTIVVLKERALLFVDPRYWEEAANTLLPGFEIVREGDLDKMTPQMWLHRNLSSGARVGIDPEQFSSDKLDELRRQAPHVVTVAVEGNLVDRVWKNRPAMASNGCWTHPDAIAGETATSKIARLRTALKEKGCAAAVVSALDQSMWLLNIRGGDSVSMPVVYCYTLVTLDTTTLFVLGGPSRVAADTRAKLEAEKVRLADYDAFFVELEKVLRHLPAKVWLDPNTACVRLIEAVSASAANGVEKSALPIDLWKALKNTAEQNGMRDAHVKDASAVTRFLAWVSEAALQGKVTEVDACNKLLEYRSQEEGFVGISFETIMGTGGNGAIIHYHPSDERPAVIGSDDMLLIDSGGHYKNGTTDITRTIHLGNPTEHQKRCYTRVLQGHVDMARAVIAPTVRPDQLDLIARLPLHSDGLDYRHGTGHGVGAYLNVHEYPCSVSSRPSSLAMQPGFIFSDEPGYYESGKFGIRIESLLLCKKAETRHTFHFANYLDFENLTVVPFSRKLIDVDLLSNDQIKYIDDFHRRCYDAVEPMLQKHRDLRALRFLQNETRPLLRPRAASFPVMPLLLASGIAVGAAAYFFSRKN